MSLREDTRLLVLGFLCLVTPRALSKGTKKSIHLASLTLLSPFYTNTLNLHRRLNLLWYPLEGGFMQLITDLALKRRFGGHPYFSKCWDLTSLECRRKLKSKSKMFCYLHPIESSKDTCAPTHSLLHTSSNIHSNIVLLLKGVAKLTWCFKFYEFGLRFLKENDRYPILLLRI